MASATYGLVKGDLHRHGTLRHAHPHTGPHEHEPHRQHSHEHHHKRGHGHSHGLMDESIKRSHEGVRTVVLALAILTITAAAQAVVFALSGSLAPLADLIHNGGDALTAILLGIAFALSSLRAERLAGLAVVAAIFISACVAAYESILRLLHPSTPSHLPPLRWGRRVRRQLACRAGPHQCRPTAEKPGSDRRRQSCARAGAYVSLAVIASAIAIAAGAPILDPSSGSP